MALLSNPFLLVHTIAATVAVVVGGAIFLRPKGTAPHRSAGRIYVALMLIANLSIMPVTARIMPIMGTGFGFFHVLALISLGSLAAGCIALLRWTRTRQPEALRSHQVNMAFSYLGLLMAFASELLVNPNLGLSPVSTPTQFWIWLGVVNVVMYAVGSTAIMAQYRRGDPLRHRVRTRVNG